MRLTKKNHETGLYEYIEPAKTQAEFNEQRKAVIQRLGEYEDRAEGEWISVEERLPKNQLARVLVFLKTNDFTSPIGFNKIDTDRFVNGKWVRWGENVTHWMPLPYVPKMKGER